MSSEKTINGYIFDIPLPPGISHGHPEVVKLTGEIEERVKKINALKPEPTTRERLAEKLREAYCDRLSAVRRTPFNDLLPQERAAYLAEADAALAFVREIVDVETDKLLDGVDGDEYDRGIVDTFEKLDKVLR